MDTFFGHLKQIEKSVQFNNTFSFVCMANLNSIPWKNLSCHWMSLLLYQNDCFVHKDNDLEHFINKHFIKRRKSTLLRNCQLGLGLGPSYVGYQ